MKRIAFVFSTVPHGTTAGREGLDALFATPALTDDLAVFFIADNVFQLLPGQKPGTVLTRDYITTFKLLGLYDIKQCWVCAASLHKHGLDPQTPFMVGAMPLEADALRRGPTNYDIILKFRGAVLHTLHRSPWLTDLTTLLRLLSEDDKLLLLQGGIIAAVGGSHYLENLRSTPIEIYTLGENLTVRGLTGRISNGIIPIDYTDSIRLTVKHSSQMAWWWRDRCILLDTSSASS